MKIPPGPKGLPIIGNLEAFEQDRLSFLRDCGEKYGDIVRYNKNIYIVYHPSLLEKIFTRTNKEFSVGFDVFQHQVDKSYTEGFMAYRKVITSGLKHSQIRNFIPEISRITSVVMREWEYGKQFDVPKTMETITGNVIANYCFGEDSEGISELATKLLDSLVVIIGNPFLFPEWLPTPTNIRIKRNTRKLQKAILQIIEKRRNVSYLGDDLLGTLLKAKWSENQGTDEQLSRALIGTLLAAHRVPASALSWLLFLITSHPEVESQIQQEMNEIIGDRLLQGKDIAKLTYLTSTVKEALRLYPPTWLNDRQVTEDCELGGYPLKKGQEVIFSAFVIQRDSRFYKSPDEFKPERWLEEFDTHRHKYSYFPFGGGPRVCIGASLSMTIMLSVTSILLKKYKLELIDGHRVKPNPKNTLLPDGLTMIAKPVLRDDSKLIATKLNEVENPCPFH